MTTQAAIDSIHRWPLRGVKPSDRRRIVGLLLVVALHLALWSLLRTRTVPTNRARSAIAPIAARLDMTRPAAPSSSNRREQRRVGAPPTLPLFHSSQRPSPAETTAPTIAPAVNETVSPASPAPAPSVPNAPLDLTLPKPLPEHPRSGAELAQQDPRANSARLSAWDRQSVALGAVPCYVMKRDDDGQIRKVVGELVAMPRTHSGATGDTRPVMVCISR